MADKYELIAVLKTHKVIKAIPELKELVRGLEKQLKFEDKISAQYSEVSALMADGVEFDEAERMVGLRK